MTPANSALASRPCASVSPTDTIPTFRFPSLAWTRFPQNSGTSEANAHRYTSHLSFQWQRELKDKFRESFEVVRSDMRLP